MYGFYFVKVKNKKYGSFSTNIQTKIKRFE